MQLTPWELKLLKLRSEGYPIKNIAADYRLAYSTIKNVLRSAYTKAGLNFKAGDDPLWRLAKIKQFLKDREPSTKKPSAG